MTSIQATATEFLVCGQFRDGKPYWNTPVFTSPGPSFGSLREAEEMIWLLEVNGYARPAVPVQPPISNTRAQLMRLRAECVDATLTWSQVTPKPLASLWIEGTLVPNDPLSWDEVRQLTGPAFLSNERGGSIHFNVAPERANIYIDGAGDTPSGGVSYIKFRTEPVAIEAAPHAPRTVPTDRLKPVDLQADAMDFANGLGGGHELLSLLGL